MYGFKPIAVQETPGSKHYCTCGNSNNKPYCDGSHKGTGKVPKAVEITEAKQVYICDCGSTGNSPFCDGTHSKKKAEGHSGHSCSCGKN